jgi:hypothetical protein
MAGTQFDTPLEHGGEYHRSAVALELHDIFGGIGIGSWKRQYEPSIDRLTCRVRELG